MYVIVYGFLSTTIRAYPEMQQLIGKELNNQLTDDDVDADQQVKIGKEVVSLKSQMVESLVGNGKDGGSRGTSIPSLSHRHIKQPLPPATTEFSLLR